MRKCIFNFPRNGALHVDFPKTSRQPGLPCWLPFECHSPRTGTGLPQRIRLGRGKLWPHTQNRVHHVSPQSVDKASNLLACPSQVRLQLCKTTYAANTSPGLYHQHHRLCHQDHPCRGTDIFLCFSLEAPLVPLKRVLKAEDNITYASITHIHLRPSKSQIPL